MNWGISFDKKGFFSKFCPQTWLAKMRKFKKVWKIRTKK